MTDDIIKRAEDLAARCERTSSVTHTAFLTPAEQNTLTEWAKHLPDCRMVLCGGHTECERKAAFFLPFYMEPEELDPAEYICAIQVRAYFGEPSHRDYMGAALGLGVKREWLGDIWVEANTATLFCLKSVGRHICDGLDMVGRCSVKTNMPELRYVKAPVRNVVKLTFCVRTMRFDAVCAGMFGLSRTKAAELINLGDASLNYNTCTKCDAQVKTGDIISMRGCGKGVVGEQGGLSRKGRVFLTAEMYK